MQFFFPIHIVIINMITKNIKIFLLLIRAYIWIVDATMCCVDIEMKNRWIKIRKIDFDKATMHNVVQRTKTTWTFVNQFKKFKIEFYFRWKWISLANQRMNATTNNGVRHSLNCSPIVTCSHRIVFALSLCSAIGMAFYFIYFFFRYFFGVFSDFSCTILNTSTGMNPNESRATNNVM